MQATRHSLGVIIIHWLTALLLLGALAAGLALEEMPSGGLRDAVRVAHFTLGVAVIALTMLRVLARLLERHRLHGAHSGPSMPRGPWLQRMASAMQALMFALMLIVPISGLLDRWARGRPVELIAGWVWAAPFDVPGGELWGEVHETTVWWLVGLVCVHVIAVGWHTWVLHDATLARILPGR